jgi:hypothetical protein
MKKSGETIMSHACLVTIFSSLATELEHSRLQKHVDLDKNLLTYETTQQ